MANPSPNHREMVPVTQYRRPHGTMVEGVLRAPSEAHAERAMALIGRGYRFEAEVLTTGQVSLTVADLGEEEDVACEIVPNGPEVIEAMGRLIEAAERVAGASE